MNNTPKIHYINFGTQTLPYANSLVEVMLHLGAKYGAILYKRGVKEGAIIVNQETLTISVDIDAMHQIQENFDSND